MTDYAAQLRALMPTHDAQVAAIIMQCTNHALPLISGPAAHLLGAGGKRLRPLLTLSFASMVAGQPNTGACELAAAVELLHAATLLHDDVIDGATQRRGKISSNVAFGNKCSVLCGDYLFACAFGGMTRAQSPRALDVLSEAAKIIVEGELMQLALRGTVPSQADYLAMIDCKTAALFAAAAEAGVAVAGGSTQHQQAARDFGMAYGRAFQIIDDWLDYTGHDAVLGKATGSDLAEGKLTLPALYAYAHADAAEQEFWQQAAQHGSSDLTQAMHYLQQHNVEQLLMRDVAQHTQQALTALETFAHSDLRHILQQLIAQGTQRTC